MHVKTASEVLYCLPEVCSKLVLLLRGAEPLLAVQHDGDVPVDVRVVVQLRRILPFYNIDSDHKWKNKKSMSS